MKPLPQNTALLVIDMQMGFDDPDWGPRNNPDAEARVAALIAAWREAGAPVIHIHHDSPHPSGRLRRGTPGNAVKPQALPRNGERIYRKSVNSAFIGTQLEADLRAKGIATLVLAGLTTNHCISTTARMAGNLGFETFVAADATATFDRAGIDGTLRRAADVHAAALSDLQGEFAHIVDSRALIDAIRAPHGQAGATRPGRLMRLVSQGARGKAVGAMLVVTAALAGASAGGRADGAVDTAAMDRSARPGDDFYGYANRGWMVATQLPAGVPRLDATAQLRALNAQRVRDLIGNAVKAASSGRAARPDVRRIANYYTSRLDTAGIEARGLTPLAGDLAAIARVTDRRALAAYLGRTLRLDDGGNQRTESLWGVWVHQGFHDPARYAAHLVQGGLGLGDRDAYLDASADGVARRARYRGHIATLLRLGGVDQPERRAARILDLETAIAGTHASRADTDDVFKTDNDWRAADFAARAPGFDWPAFFAAAGLNSARDFIVWQPQAVIGSARLAATQPLEAWRDYLTFHLIDHYASVLPRAIGDEERAFDEAPPPDPDRQAIAATEAVFGDAIGRLYVERYFPPAAKAAVARMVADIRTAFRARLANLAWMSPATRARALAKLAALRIGLGYPERWTDTAALAVVRGDAFGNLRRAEAFAYRREVGKLGRPVDPDEWAGQLHPQMAGAILNLSPNSMQFAAGLFQPPYFDPAGDAASNYGSAGAGLAHEVSHSFDEVGNTYDAQGRLGLWWTDADAARYRAATAPLAVQLDTCFALPGIAAHGKQVLAESWADLTGLTVAHDAYLLSLHGRPDRVLQGLTGAQRFFIAFAQRWRVLQTDASLRRQIDTDPHAPPPCRSGLVRNVDAWVRAFDIKPGDALYLPPGARIRVW